VPFVNSIVLVSASSDMVIVTATPDAVLLPPAAVLLPPAAVLLSPAAAAAATATEVVPFSLWVQVLHLAAVAVAVETYNSRLVFRHTVGPNGCLHPSLTLLAISPGPIRVK
jgi:low temperature requirement protein LtrA